MASNDTDKSVFVVTFPLKTEAWQEDRINKMMRLLTVFYNEKQNVLLKRYIHLSHSLEYKVAKNDGLFAFKRFMQEQGFSKFGIEKVFSDSAKSKSTTNEQLLSHGLNSDIIQELAHRAWSAWEKKLFGQGRFIRLDNEVETFKSRNHKGHVTGFAYSLEDYTISMMASKPNKHVMFTIPFVVNSNSEYEIFALNQDVRNIV